MSIPPTPDLELDDLMRRIRVEVARRRAEATPGGAPAQKPAPPAPPPAIELPGGFSPPRLHLGAPFTPVADRPLCLEDLAGHHDAAFVANAYRTLLHREPDRVGGAHYLDSLRRGELDEVEILWCLHRSPEGRALQVPVRGLAVSAMLRKAFRLAGLGPVLRWARDILTLPRRLGQLDRVGRDHYARWSHIEEHLAASGTATAVALSAHREALATSQSALEAHLGAARSLAVEIASLRASLARTDLGLEAERAASNDRDGVLREEVERGREDSRALAQGVERLRADLSREAEALRRTSDAVALEARRSRALAERGLEVSSVLEALGDRTGALERLAFPALDDALYSALEDRFRGTRQDILSRAEVYLPLVGRAGAGAAGRPVLDLGCGRGEWLELLTSSGLEARGVDRNGAFVREGASRGLPVEECDALAFLRSRGDASAGAVTAFHVLEHIVLPDLLAVLAETARVLAPGGVAIFETPNPANLTVGAHTFYMDPTHHRPLPSALLAFLMEQSGLSESSVMELHPPSPATLPPPGSNLPEKLLAHFACAQDYALVGWKR